MPGEVTFGLNQPDNTSTTHHHKAWKKLRSSSPFGKQPMSKEDIVAHVSNYARIYILYANIVVLLSNLYRRL